MDAYLRRILLEVESCMDRLLMVELRNKIEEAAENNGRHRCNTNYCRTALLVYYPVGYVELMREFRMPQYTRHYETLLYGEMRLSGHTHASALLYSGMDRLYQRLRENFVGLFSALWEQHPESRGLSHYEQVVEVEIEIASADSVDEEVIVLENE